MTACQGWIRMTWDNEQLDSESMERNSLVVFLIDSASMERNSLVVFLIVELCHFSIETFHREQSNAWKRNEEVLVPDIQLPNAALRCARMQISPIPPFF